MIQDSVGKCVLPLNDSVLVLSDRCQLVAMGEHGCSCAYVTAKQTRVPVGPLVGLRSVARLKTRQMGSPRGLIEIRLRDVSKDGRVLICERR